MENYNTVGRLKKTLADIDDDYTLEIIKQKDSSHVSLIAVEPEKPESEIRGRIELYYHFLK